MKIYTLKICHNIVNDATHAPAGTPRARPVCNSIRAHYKIRKLQNGCIIKYVSCNRYILHITIYTL